MNTLKSAICLIAILILTTGLASANDIWSETPDIRSGISNVNSVSDRQSFSGNQQPKNDIWAETPDLKSQEIIYDQVSDSERVRTCTANPELYEMTPDLNPLVLAGSYSESFCR